MKEEVYAPDPLNEQASILVDAQTDIKTAIKQSVLSGEDQYSTKARIKKIIDRAIARIRSPTLLKDAQISLMQFANKAYEQFNFNLAGIPAGHIAAAVVLIRAITSRKGLKETYVPANSAERKAASVLSYTAFNKGIPLQEFQKKYMERVDRALQSLAEQQALDPNDLRGYNSLRNLAEMQVRYERHQAEITGFKERGTKLVVCSVHADCSGRCSGWQGRVYSMDGTEGYTEDGRHYAPLEVATDVYYTTKSGRVYKNGLLGFNCRHKLYEYKPGMAIPTVSKRDQEREYDITKTQRALERNVIAAREMALEKKGVLIGDYKKWKAEAQRRFEVYKAFCKEHGRAYYPDRVKIL